MVIIIVCVADEEPRGGLNLAAVPALQTAASFHASTQREPPTILTGGLARQLAKGSCEIGLSGKAEREGDIDQGSIRPHQQCFAMREPLRANVLMRGAARGELERAGEVEPAQAGDSRQAGNGEIAFQVGFYKRQHAGQSASVQTLSRDGLECLRGWSADLLLNEPRGEAGS
jgi:hypothetical protein